MSSITLLRNFTCNVPISQRIVGVVSELLLSSDSSRRGDVRHVPKIEFKRHKTTLKEVYHDKHRDVFRYEGPFSMALKRVKVILIDCRFVAIEFLNNDKMLV